MSSIKNVQQKFEGIMFGLIYILGLSILTILDYSKGPTSCKERKVLNKENIVSKKVLLIQC